MPLNPNRSINLHVFIGLSVKPGCGCGDVVGWWSNVAQFTVQLLHSGDSLRRRLRSMHTWIPATQPRRSGEIAVGYRCHGNQVRILVVTGSIDGYMVCLSYKPHPAWVRELLNAFPLHLGKRSPGRASYEIPGGICKLLPNKVDFFTNFFRFIQVT